MSFGNDTDELSKRYCFDSIRKFTYNGLSRLEEVYCTKPNDTEAVANYKKYFIQANPSIPYPDVVINDKVFSNDHNIIYNVRYHTQRFGLRITPFTNLHSHQHLIISGDSNVFGLGVNDGSTLPSRLAKTINSHAVYNLGLTATGPNALLYFLQQFGLKNIIPGNQRSGAFVYDFHYYLIERVIGSKDFLKWGIYQARYAFVNNKIEYVGTFNHYWLSLFYKLLNYIPYNEMLIPNLPRISQDHLYLTAKIMTEIKKEYFKQTNSQNRFVISMNPKYINSRNAIYVESFIKLLQKENIEVIGYSPLEILEMPAFADGHLNETGLDNYSKMIIKKLKIK